MITFDFTNKNVVVTGASMGLGKEIASSFARAHANVVIADINMIEAEKTQEELATFGGKVLSFRTDVSNYDDVMNLIKFANEQLGSVDVLVNNAGICVTQNLDEIDKKMIDKMISININGTIYGCRAVIPYMKKQHSGKIVNLSSVAAKLGWPASSVYASTKAAVLELTACLARELAHDNINVNCVLPGIIRTPLWEHMLEEMTDEDDSKKDEVFASYTKDIPLGRPQEPKDIANAILFLCSEEASNITAQNLGIDGGQTY